MGGSGLLGRLSTLGTRNVVAGTIAQLDNFSLDGITHSITQEGSLFGGAGDSFLSNAANRVVKCFPAGTAVVMADGTTKAIEEVEDGDIVIAADPERGAEPRPCRVAGILHSKTHRLITVGLDSNGDGVEDGSVSATGEHPFWAKGRGWVNAENLKPSDVLTSLSASSATVVRIDTARSEAWISTYNLDVEGVDAFFVLAGRIPVLVHNTEIGLGLNDDPWPLNDLNRTRKAGALTFENAAWQKAGLTSLPWREVDGSRAGFWRSFEQAAGNASSIRFDVTSFDEARFLANPSGGMTNRGLQHILNNPSLLEKTTFYRGGQAAVWNGTTFVCP